MGQNISWVVDGMEYHGRSWGNPQGRRILMLHGWMDNVDSFAQLAPLLPDYHCVALDLSGHGMTDHRAAHATYNIWDDLPQIEKILQALNWENCTIIGHSRGAIIGTLFAAAMPHRVTHLIGLDAIMVEASDLDIATTLHKFITQTQSQHAKGARVFASKQDYINRRIHNGNAPLVAEKLAHRMLEPLEQGYRLRADLRLFASSAVKLKEHDIVDVFKALQCKVLTLWAENGILNGRPKMQNTAQLAQKHVQSYHAMTLPGDHHFMMDPVHAHTIADEIKAFLN